MIFIKKYLFIFSIIITIFSFFFIDIKASNNLIIIDPGHGGRDRGASYKGVYEDTLNLEVANTLKDIFIDNGYSILMTRENEMDLCGDKFIKKEDMMKRSKFINNYNPLLVLSIHMNTYSNEKYKGAQVFYSNANSKSVDLANLIQNKLSCYTDTTRKIVKRNNIYLLNSIVSPACIIECGFITNSEERNKLLDQDYRRIIGEAIYAGTTEFIRNYLRY